MPGNQVSNSQSCVQRAWQKCLKQRATGSVLVLLLLCDLFSAVSLCAFGWPVYVELFVARFFALLIGLVFAIQLGSGAWSCHCRFARCCTQIRGRTANELSQVEEGGARQCLWTRSSDVDVVPLRTFNHQPMCSSPFLSECSSDVQECKDLKESRKFKRNGVIVACFVFVILQSIYVGISVLGVARTSTLAAVCITITIISSNAEFLCLKRLVASATDEDGELLPHLHEHPLFFQSSVHLAQCQVCGERIGQRTGGYERFECKMCRDEGGKGGGKGGRGGVGFTVCMLCYRKQHSKVSTQDGILRGDKGPKIMQPLTSWGYFARAMRLTKQFSGVLAVAILSIIAGQTTRLLMPNSQGEIINALVKADRSAFHEHLYAFIGLSVGSCILGCVQGLAVEVVVRRLTMDMRQAMFESLITQDIAFFDGAMTGQLTSRMTNDVAQVLAPVRQLLNTVLANVLLLAGGTFMCLFISWKLTILACTMIGPVIYLTNLYANWSRKLNLKVQTSVADANAVATEALRNIRTVRSFGAENVEVSEFRGHLKTALRNGMKDAFASAGVNSVNKVLSYAATALVLGYGGASVLEGAGGLSVGQLITFNLYWNMLGQALKGLNSMVASLVRAASSAQRVFEIIDLEPDIKLNGGFIVPIASEPCALEFRNIFFTYQMRPDREVLSGMSFSIQSGQTVAIVGRSGAGKTTLISLLLRFYDPQAGELLLNGEPLSSYDLNTYKKLVGVVSQDTQVFCRSIRDNLVYGMPSEEVTDEMLIEAARMANAHDFIQLLDGGYKAMVGEGGLRLSGGQRQRLAIARALLRRPTFLFLDEATSALDAENEGQVQAALDQMMASMAGRCSVVLIAHRLSTVMNADQIVVLDEGRLAEQGQHDELLQNDKIYAQLVTRQLAKQANSLTAQMEMNQQGNNSDPSQDLKLQQSTEEAGVDSVDCLFDEVLNVPDWRQNFPRGEIGMKGASSQKGKGKGGKKGKIGKIDALGKGLLLESMQADRA